MAAHFETRLDQDGTTPPCRALVPWRQDKTCDVADAVPADAAFLASLLASAVHSETARRRRRASPGLAIARYRAGEALAREEAPVAVGAL